MIKGPVPINKTKLMCVHNWCTYGKNGFQYKGDGLVLLGIVINTPNFFCSFNLFFALQGEKTFV